MLSLTGPHGSRPHGSPRVRAGVLARASRRRLAWGRARSGSDPFTLAVDCGGGGIKASVLDAAGTLHAPAVRVPTPYPLPPERLVATIADIAAELPGRRPRRPWGCPG